MSKVNICNVVVLDTPSPFKNPFQFEITFECLENLADDLDWRIIYVGTAESEDYDQVLDSVLVGPVPAGKHMFVFQAPAPDTTKIPVADAVGVTVVLLTCSYRGQEFIRVGYYVNNEYPDPEMRENPPALPDYDQLVRNIIAESPRVTKFPINWGESSEPMEENGENIQPEGTNPLTNQDASCSASNQQSALGLLSQPDIQKQNSLSAHDSMSLTEPMAS